MTEQNTQKPAQISVVIPHFQRRDSLSLLLNDLLAQKKHTAEIIVVDDCSKDGSFEKLKSEFEQVTFLKNPKNGGPSICRNIGIKHAKGSVIVGIDSDVTIPDPLFFDKISKRFDADPSLTGLSFRIKKSDGISEDTPRWHHPLRIEEYCSKAFETDYFSGTSFAFRTKEMIEAGAFPEDFFQFYEEVELALRIIDQGGKIEYDPSIAVDHHPGSRPNRDRVRFYYNPRNQILLAVKLYPLQTAIAFLFPRLAYYLIKTTLYGCPQIFIKAIRDAIRLGHERKKTRVPLSARTRTYLKTLRSGVLSDAKTS